MTNEQVYKLVDAALAILSEHFDASQVLVRWSDPQGTSHCYRGCGNFYARAGMAQEFLDIDHGQTLAKEIAKIDPPDGDEWKETP